MVELEGRKGRTGSKGRGRYPTACSEGSIRKGFLDRATHSSAHWQVLKRVRWIDLARVAVQVREKYPCSFVCASACACV